MKFNYKQRSLDSIWEIIRGENCGFREIYAGLIEVNFVLSLPSFKKRYLHRTRDDFETSIVLTDLDRVIKKLTGSNDFLHHLSCAARRYDYQDNSALCIHYRRIRDGSQHTLAIPGINYLPL